MLFLRRREFYSPGAAVPLRAREFDILITNGRIFNGTGNPWFYADVGITGNTIAATGDLAGKNFIDIIRKQKRNGFDIVADLIRDEPDILFASGSQSGDDMRYAMQRDWVMVSSDGGALPVVKETDKAVRGHPRSFSSQAIILRKFVREEKLLTLERDGEC